MMLMTTTIHEKITVEIVKAIERGQCPPWRKPWRNDLENTGFPCDLTPFTGISVLLLNMAASEKGFNSKFWQTQPAWEAIGGRVSGDGTMIPNRGDPNQWITVFNADQVFGGMTGIFRSRPRSTPLVEDYGPAEAIIATSGATIIRRPTLEAAYYYQEDHIIFPFKEQFLFGPGGLVAYYDSLLHELSHFSEPRLGWDCSDECVRELRAEITAPFITSQLGVPVFTEMKKLTNHRNYLPRWVRAMKDDPMLIFQVAADASAAAEYLLSLKG
jgi:antirestriction protein ArdC